jgi:hypothetical protein
MFSLCVKSKMRSKISTPLQIADDWIHRTKLGLPRFERIVQLFATCVRLRDTIALFECYFELYYPSAFKRTIYGR